MDSSALILFGDLDSMSITLSDVLFCLNLTFRTQLQFRGKPFLLAYRTVTSSGWLKQAAVKLLLSSFHFWSGLLLCQKLTGSTDNLPSVFSNPVIPSLTVS